MRIHSRVYTAKGEKIEVVSFKDDRPFYIMAIYDGDTQSNPTLLATGVNKAEVIDRANRLAKQGLPERKK